MADRGTRRGPPTIYDVAAEAGVAPSTVSRTFARPGRVSAETAARIREVADRLGYRANPMARALSTSQSRMVALMVADVTNPVFAAMIRGAQAQAAEDGFVVLLEDARESGAVEREALERVLPVVEGIVLGGSRMPDSTIRTLAKQVPLIVLNRDVAGVLSVVTDNARGMRRAVEHLGGLGHDSLVYVSGPEASWADGARVRAFREAGHELQLATRATRHHAPTVAGGVAAAREMLDAATGPPTAVVAYNDLMAIGVMRALQDAGVAVADDVSVVGFDDILVSQLVSPPLTTVAAPLRAMGETAVQNLLAVVRGAQPHAERAFVLPARLVVRGSTAHRRRKRTSPALGTTRVSGSAESASRSTSSGER
ncbi:LacI family DNA-binding transcriptional regulator [Aquipuribacter nitratireducens]|uniref:LacI family DNA-binding transcriptional regulator n=1 Tax=Aquipuribacter nitratireducens TaxID=650104 RepID=A0ABW0GR57_9MICO